MFVVPLCVLAGISAAQKPSDWRPSAVKPADFAKKVDTALLNLKNALGQASYRCRFFDGSIGQSDLTNRIRDRKTLRVYLTRYGLGCLRGELLADSPLLSEAQTSEVPSC